MTQISLLDHNSVGESHEKRIERFSSKYKRNYYQRKNLMKRELKGNRQQLECNDNSHRNLMKRELKA